MNYTPAKAIVPSLEEAIKKVTGKLEGRPLTVRAGVDYDYAKKYKQDPYFSVTHLAETSPGSYSSGIASDKHIVAVAHTDYEKLHHLMDIKKMHLRSATTGAPMHANANAYYHAGIGEHAKQNTEHLAHHLDISTEHADSIMNHVHSVGTDDAKKKIIDAHIEDLKPRWQHDCNAAHKAIEALK